MASRPPARWRRGESLAALRALLARGGVVAIPTGSSYGLAAAPSDRRGVEAIYRLKSRQQGQPLPVVAANLEQLAELGVAVDEPVFRRLASLWPAPLSLIVPAAPGIPAAAGGDTLAVRVPAYAPLRQLLADLGTALTATSANLSGQPPVLEPEDLEGLLAGHDALIVDGGALPGGAPSTLLALGADGLTVLRRGRYPIADLRRKVPDLPMAVRGGPAP